MGYQRLSWTSERSISVTLTDSTHQASNPIKLTEWMQSRCADMIRSMIPSATSVLIEVNIERHSLTEVWSAVEHAVESFERSLRDSSPIKSRLVEIPVCYDVQLAPDLEQVAQSLGCMTDYVIELHSSFDYVVDTLGFMPGFGYLSPLHEALRLPRKETPLLRVPAGSVGIAEGMTAVYPHQSAGGWHLIGRTPMRLFDPTKSDPTLLRVGDTVRFVRITRDDFVSIARDQWGNG